METTIIRNGKPTVVPDYATVQGILLGAMSAFVIFITIIGPECVSCLCHPSKLRNTDFPWCRNHGSHFESQNTAFEEGGSENKGESKDEEKLPGLTDAQSEEISDKL